MKGNYSMSVDLGWDSVRNTPHVETGDEVAVLVLVNGSFNTPGNDPVTGFQCVLGFDPSVLEPIEVLAHAPTHGQVQGVIGQGNVSIGGTGFSKLVGWTKVPVATVRFRVVGTLASYTLVELVTSTVNGTDVPAHGAVVIIEDALYTIGAPSAQMTPGEKKTVFVTFAGDAGAPVPALRQKTNRIKVDFDLNEKVVRIVKAEFVLKTDPKYLVGAQTRLTHDTNLGLVHADIEYASSDPPGAGDDKALPPLPIPFGTLLKLDLEAVGKTGERTQLNIYAVTRFLTPNNTVLAVTREDAVLTIV